MGVTDAQDRLIGLLTVENLGEMMMIYSARPDAPAGPWGKPRGMSWPAPSSTSEPARFYAIRLTRS